MKRKYALGFGLVLGLAGISSSAMADRTPRGWDEPELDSAIGGMTLERCRQSKDNPDHRDYLGAATKEVKAKAEARINWAFNCGHIVKTPMMMKLFYKTLNKKTGDWEDLPGYKIKYPTFAYNKPKEHFPIWKPNLATCDMPADVLFLGVCPTGCYDSNQLVDFGEGLLTVPDARQSGVSKLKVLSNGSSFDSLKFQELDIGYFTESDETDEVLLRFEAEDGDPLTVTSNHPLVDKNGQVREAGLFKAGEYLVREDGTKAKIAKIVEVEYKGKVYNVAPKSDLAQENIMVAQGYLNGSAKYQNEQIRNFERTMARSVIPADLL